MKTPEELSKKLARQWQNADLRERRLQKQSEWPLKLSIGKPPAKAVESKPDRIRRHIAAWRAVRTGHVEWTAVKYRSAAEYIEIPITWCLDRPSDWIQACADKTITEDYQNMSHLCSDTPRSDHLIWLRKRHLWCDKPLTEVIQASRLADALRPGCAAGRPLRALPYAGIDSKFFERHRRLVCTLLDLRHDDAVTDQGLEPFLNAALGNDHWILLVDLDGELLPFSQQRVRASELTSLDHMPGAQLLLIENEQVLHLLPPAKGCIAILGSGLNLTWLKAPWIAAKKVAYWGDIDTWGLRMLAEARLQIPHLDALLMDTQTFREFGSSAVAELSRVEPPEQGLTSSEIELFRELKAADKGRLEQEFISSHRVGAAIEKWTNS